MQCLAVFSRPDTTTTLGRHHLEAVANLEQAAGVLAVQPESRVTLEQAFNIRLELRTALNLLGDGRRMLQCLREGEALAERLNDDRRRGRVCAFLTNTHSMLGELDAALASGGRAMDIVHRLGDVDLRTVNACYLVQAHFLRGDYERTVELAIGNIAALPIDRMDDFFGMGVLPAVWDRSWLMMSLGWLGRFAEAAAYEAEIIRLAQAAGHANTIGWAQCAAGTLHMLRGDRAKARGPFETFLAEVRTGNVGIMLPPAMAFSAWRLAQFGETAEALERLRVTEQLLLEQAARGWIGQTGWLWGLLGRAAFVLGRPDEARRLAGRAIDCSPHQPGFAAYALLLQGDIAASSQGFDAERGETCYRAALALAEPRGMRPLIARCHLGLGRLHRRLGRRGQADRFLETAMAMHRGMEMSLEDSRQDETMGVP